MYYRKHFGRDAEKSNLSHGFITMDTDKSLGFDLCASVSIRG
jgi:hypothetical protein